MTGNVRCPNCGTENQVDTDNKFCKECGKDLSKYVVMENENLDKTHVKIDTIQKEKMQENTLTKGIKILFFTLTDLISFLISACFMSLIFALPLVIAIIGMSDGIDSDNVFQQIYNSINTTGIALGIGIGVVAGIVTTANLRNKAQLNRIEDRIEEIQKSLANKEQK